MIISGTGDSSFSCSNWFAGNSLISCLFWGWVAGCITSLLHSRKVATLVGIHSESKWGELKKDKTVSCEPHNKANFWWKWDCNVESRSELFVDSWTTNVFYLQTKYPCEKRGNDSHFTYSPPPEHFIKCLFYLQMSSSMITSMLPVTFPVVYGY